MVFTHLSPPERCYKGNARKGKGRRRISEGESGKGRERPQRCQPNGRRVHSSQALREEKISAHMARYRRSWTPSRRGIPHGVIFLIKWYPSRHGIPNDMVSHITWYPSRHDIPHDVVRRGIPHDVASLTTWYPSRRDIPSGSVSDGSV